MAGPLDCTTLLAVLVQGELALSPFLKRRPAGSRRGRGGRRGAGFGGGGKFFFFKKTLRRIHLVAHATSFPLSPRVGTHPDRNWSATNTNQEKILIKARRGTKPEIAHNAKLKRANFYKGWKSL